MHEMRYAGEEEVAVLLGVQFPTAFLFNVFLWDLFRRD